MLICLGGGVRGEVSVFQRRKELFHVWLLQVPGQHVCFSYDQGHFIIGPGLLEVCLHCIFL